MNDRRVWLGTFAVLGALVLGACSSSSTPTASTNAPGSTGAAPPTSVQGVNPTGGFCSQLKGETGKISQLGTTFGAAVASHDFATMKQTLGSYFTAVEQAMAQVEASMSSAPSNVQAALGVVNQYFSKLQTEIAASTSLKQLEASMASSGNAAQLKAAGKTLDAYTKSQCGDISSPTP